MITYEYKNKLGILHIVVFGCEFLFMANFFQNLEPVNSNEIHSLVRENDAKRKLYIYDELTTRIGVLGLSDDIRCLRPFSKSTVTE